MKNENAKRPDRYDVIWDRPSQDSSGSMPLGNGDIGLNLWVEEGGDLLFYISKTDAWNENARLLKLGRIRLKLQPNPFAKGYPFLQRLRLGRGEIEIRAGRKGSEVRVNILVDANHPLIRADLNGDRKFHLEVDLEVWRQKPRTLSGRELFSAYGMDGGPHEVVESPDTIPGHTDDRIIWFHRNRTSIWPETMKLQGMGMERWARRSHDPLINRTFGGLIKCSGLRSEGPTILRSSRPRKRFNVWIHVLTSQTERVEEWLEQLGDQVAHMDRLNAGGTRREHRRWWREFWARSWIHVGSPEMMAAGHSSGQTPYVVSRGYALQRFITACAGRGRFPVKFNGSIFTVDAKEDGETYDADYRRWGGPYWFQNTRLAYWPLLASGDFEEMLPLFRMFAEALPMAKARTKLYFGHGGAFFPETMYFWGSYANTNYGWDRAGKHVSHVDNRYIRWHYEGALELLAIMLDYHEHTDDRSFLRRSLLPFADEILRFYSCHYEDGSDGRLRLDPSQALETYQRTVNPVTDIAGLRWTLDRLIALGDGQIGVRRRQRWRALRARIPPLPTEAKGEARYLLPAQEVVEGPNNSENPELYAVFPFRLYGVGKPDLGMALRTFENRRFKGNKGWQQDDIQAALLGLAGQARRSVLERFSSSHAGSRFPAFWGPNFDWIPDQDHGGVGMIALQRMLLQAEGDRILLFPAWPKDWDVQFRLHVPHRTTVEGTYRAGGLTRLKVTPGSRAKDVIVLKTHET